MNDLDETSRLLCLAANSRRGRIYELIGQIAVLWPSLDSDERVEWCRHFSKVIYGNDGQWLRVTYLITNRVVDDAIDDQYARLKPNVMAPTPYESMNPTDNGF